MKRWSCRNEISAQGWTYPCRCVNSQHTFRLIKGEEARVTNFVLVEELSIRPGLYSAVDATEAVEKNHDVPLGIDEAQENPIAFEEMGISKWAK